MQKNQDQVQARIQELCQQINHANFEYYVQDCPTLTDAEFDKLLQELKNLEDIYPELRSKNSPTQRVGGTRQESSFAAHIHQQPMLSLDNVYNGQELQSWWQRVQKALPSDQSFSVTVEPKMDGLSLSLIYKNGELQSAATRGDGQEGEDVSANVKTIRSVPLMLQNAPDQFECRGEVFITKQDFEKLNHELFVNQEKQFANARNAAAGSLRQKDPAQTAKRPLRFFVHSPGKLPQNFNAQTHHGFIEYCHNLKLPTTSKYLKQAQSVQEVLDIYNQILQQRQDLPFEIDGVVVKVNDFKQQQFLGFTNKFPRWAVAFKFLAHQAESFVREIFFSVGRTGTITPVAKIDPVECGGVTISSISLHNFDEIARLQLRQNDRVLIERAGDVIPKVVRVLESLGERDIVPPSLCPSCQSPVMKDEQEVALRCINFFCRAQLERSLQHFASREGLDIQGLGESVVAELVQKNFVKNFADLFFLTKDHLLQCDLFADKRADNLLSSIAKSKSCTLAQLINALGIRHVGEKLAFTLAEKYETLDNLMQASLEELMQVPEVGPNVAESISNFFAKEQTQELIAKFKTAELNMTQPKREIVANSIFEGKTFVFTGELSIFTRSEAEDKVLALGGKTSGSVSKKTSYVVSGPNAGSKLKKAQSLNVPVLSEEEFLKMLQAD